MSPSPAGRRVLATGAARGIRAALSRRPHARGARVALAGLEPGPPAGSWTGLHAHLDDRRALELLPLVGHYDLLATTITALRVPPDPPR